MRAFAAVFAREVFHRRLVFLVGLSSGLIFLFAAALHGWNAPGNAEVRLLAGAVGGLALASALALLYGASTIAGETAEKRISFYFSRPIPSGALWAGKLLAAVFVSFAAGSLVYLPAWLTGPSKPGGAWGVDLTPGLSMLLGLAAVVTCVLVAHALVTVARLRSPWVVLDFVLATILLLVALASLATLARHSSDGLELQPWRIAGWVLASGLSLAFLVGIALQVSAGRTDARRSHGAFSVGFFGVFSLAVAFAGIQALWSRAAGARDLARVSTVEAAGRGAWTFVEGPISALRGEGRFLYVPKEGRSIRIEGHFVHFSEDGTRTAWGEPRFGFFERKDNRLDLVVADLATGRPVSTGLETSGWSDLTLSPSGRRLAIRTGRSLEVYDVSDPANPKQIGAFPLAEDRRAFAFADEDTIRLFPGLFNRLMEFAPSDLEITELSLPSRKSIVTGRFGRENLPFLRLSADARYFVGTRKVSENSSALTLHDGRTGALLATLSDDLSGAQARFVTGNRIALAGIAGTKAKIGIFFEGEEGRAPTAGRTIDLGPARRLVLGGEIAPGRVAVSLFPLEENLPTSARDAKLAIVDTATGAVFPLGEGLAPANWFGWWTDPVLPPAEAGSPASLLFLDASGRLVRLDPATGAQTVLLGRSK